jgi:NADPH:quinone reductase-like Zn-dependent oxidoreductase
MRVVAVTSLGGPDVLQMVEWPDPVPGPGQVLVRISAVCVQPADIAARMGVIPGGAVDPPFLAGWDFAGEVVALGDDGGAASVGDRVAGMVPWFQTRGAPGAYAELIAAPVDWLVPVPDDLDLVPAATIGLNGLTAAQGLDLMELPAATTILVSGASGGVGGFAVQLAARAGHRVIAVAAGDDDDEWLRRLGANQVLPRTADLAASRPVPAVFDAVPLGPAAAAAVADGGVVVTTRPTPPVDPARKARQRLVLIRPDQDRLRDLVADVASGRLLTRVATTLPLADAAAAHRMVEAGGLRGKVVLIP